MFRKIPLFNIFKKTFRDFKALFVNLMIFEIVFKIISEITIIPLSIIGVNFLIQRSGNPLVGNWEIITFFISPLGILTFFAWFFFFILRLFIEISGILTIIHGDNLKGIKYVFNIIKNSILTIPKTIYHFFIKYIVILIISIIISFLLGFIVIYFKNQNNSTLSTIFQNLYENRILFTLGISAGVISLCIFVVNRIFIFHYFLIFKKNLSSSIEYSKKLIKPYFWEVFFSFILVITFVSSIFLLSLLPFTILKDFPANTFFNGSNGNIAAAFVVSGFYILFSGISLIIVPFLLCYINNLFCFLNEDLPKDGTVLKIRTYSGIVSNSVNKKLKFFFFISILSIFLLITFFISVYITTPIENQLPKITAHRGSSVDVPGNSVSSVLKAISEGTDYIEFDIQITEDGKIILFHDKSTYSLDKNAIPIFMRKYEDLENTKIGKGNYENEKIPLLAEIFEKIKFAPQVGLNIEIKNYAKKEEIVDLLFKLIKMYDVQNEIIISSTDYSILKKVKTVSPKIKTGIILMLFFGNIFSNDADFFSLSSGLVNQELVDKIHDSGKEVHVWTVNDIHDMKMFIDLGVDNIITDDPLLLLKELYKRKFLKYTQRNYLYLLNL